MCIQPSSPLARLCRIPVDYPYKDFRPFITWGSGGSFPKLRVPSEASEAVKPNLLGIRPKLTNKGVRPKEDGAKPRRRHGLWCFVPDFAFLSGKCGKCRELQESTVFQLRRKVSLSQGETCKASQAQNGVELVRTN